MSLKTFITASYGTSIYADTAKLQQVNCKAATAKNQTTFLNRCIYHKLIPRFLQIKSPYESRRVRNLTEEHKKKLLIATRNDAKTRYFRRTEESKRITDSLKEQLSGEHFEMIIRITTSSKEKKFIETRTKLKKKFELMYASKYKRPYNTVLLEPTVLMDREEPEPGILYTNTNEANRTTNNAREADRTANNMHEPDEPEPGIRYTHRNNMNVSNGNRTLNHESEETEPGIQYTNDDNRTTTRIRDANTTDQVHDPYSTALLEPTVHMDSDELEPGIQYTNSNESNRTKNHN